MSTVTGSHVEEILHAILRQASERDAAAKHHASEATRFTREAAELRTLAAQVEQLSSRATHSV